MHASRTLCRLVLRCATSVAGVALAVSVLPAGAVAAAGPVDPPPSGVRLVVRTTTSSAAAEVVALGLRRGARVTGRVPRLRAVTLETTPARARSLRLALLRHGDVTSVDRATERYLTEETNDPRFADQRTYLEAIRATAAWARPAHGAPTVRIAVVDSGADVTHPDLAGKVAGTYDAVNGGPDVRDVVGHGTGVASVAAAATNNGVGLAGVGYDSALLIAKVSDRTSRIFTDDLARGIVWAVDSGADVINLSLGGPTTDRLEHDAIAYAVERDVLVVAAAGNDGTSRKQYPAANRGVLAVGATTVDGTRRADFSSFGRWVDVAAPGRDILVATAGGGYEKADGTSFSAPLVAGQVALLEAHRPGRTAAELSAAVIRSADQAQLGFAGGLVDVDASLDLLPPASTPTITSPAPAADVSGLATVSATSTAPRVRLTLADLTAIVPTQSGVAATVFPTYGLAGPQVVTATDCSAIDQCGPATASSTASVTNPAPVLTAPADGSSGSADRVTATADAPGGAVRFQVDSRIVATDAVAPYAAVLSTADLADGRHTVSAVLCRADAAVCDYARPSSAGIDVARLHPSLAGRSTGALSPGSDGRQDKVTLSYRLESRQQTVLRVRDAAGAVVLDRRLGAAAKDPGRYRARWFGRRSGGGFVRNGTYTVEISTRQPDGPLVGLVTTTVVVDRAAPRIGKVMSSRATVLPVRDGYRDTTRVSARVSEPARWLELQVHSAYGRLVRTERIGRRPAGGRYIDWDGRTDGGAVAPSGTYSVRLVAQDLAGNRTASAAAQVNVSGQRLVRRHGSMTVSARASLQETFSDDCSLVLRHMRGTHKSWVGYISSAVCSSDDAYAVGDHQLRLPRAARYGSVQISAYGGRGDPESPGTARVTYYDRHQNLSDNRFVLRPATRTYTGDRVDASRHLINHRILRWSTMTTGDAWYDVKHYTVSFSYDVLR